MRVCDINSMKSIIAGVFAAIALAQPADVALTHTIRVPLDYGDPTAGTAELAYEFGAPFDASKATVMVIADGQQFYVHAGAMAELQRRLFGERVNVVGVISRGTTSAFIDATTESGKTNWLKAWQVFNYTQWLGDIESVRHAVVGDGQVMLYGRSGGAYLVHQYLAAHSDHVSRAFTQSPVNPVIVRELGIRLDRFWEALGHDSPQLQPVLLDVLKMRPQERTRILLTLQRQHFFVPAEQLKAARARLIHALALQDEVTYATLRKKYEVDAVLELLKSKESIPQNVRVLELIGPSGAFDETAQAGVSPLIEPQREFAGELIKLQREGRIATPGFDLAPLRLANTEVFILAARDDEAVDYRTSIALAYCYPHHLLFIARDNHNFAHVAEAAADTKLAQAFYESGLESPAMKKALAEAAGLRWTE
jgi:pimeloyl-ACP methyl ester carboxylesterase